MLKTPRMRHDPVLDVVARALGGNNREHVLEDGAVQISSFSLDIMIWGRNSPEFYMGYPEWSDSVGSYGVCDTPLQFLDRYRDQLKADPRTFVVSFTHIAKDPSNKGHGGGWRWHKWGEYIGEGTHNYEYLDDEDGFDDGVYVYHVYQTDGPEMCFKDGKLVEGPRYPNFR